MGIKRVHDLESEGNEAYLLSKQEQQARRQKSWFELREQIRTALPQLAKLPYEATTAVHTALRLCRFGAGDNPVWWEGKEMAAADLVKMLGVEHLIGEQSASAFEPKMKMLDGTDADPEYTRKLYEFVQTAAEDDPGEDGELVMSPDSDSESEE